MLIVSSPTRNTGYGLYYHIRYWLQTNMNTFCVNGHICTYYRCKMRVGSEGIEPYTVEEEGMSTRPRFDSLNKRIPQKVKSNIMSCG